jgi:hypothetical protein
MAARLDSLSIGPVPMRFALPLTLCLAAWGLLVPPAAFAADPDTTALQHEVSALREMVLNLQARVSRLEGQPVAAEPAAAAAPVAAAASAKPAAPSPAAPAAAVPIAAAPAVPVVAAAAPTAAPPGYLSPEGALRANWAQIKPAMAQADVTRLLGAPTKKFTLDGRHGWYYVYPGIGTGSVFFTDEGRVTSRQAPFGWGG